MVVLLLLLLLLLMLVLPDDESVGPEPHKVVPKRSLGSESCFGGARGDSVTASPQAGAQLLD